MAYTIHKLNPVSLIAGDIIDGGQTRNQVIRALDRLGIKLTSADKLPRFGKQLVIALPSRECYVIRVA